MSLLILVILIMVVLNAGGGFHSGYRSSRYYGPSWGGILLIILVLYLLGIR